MRTGNGPTEDAHGGAPAASPRRPRCCPCHRHGSSAGFRTHGQRGLARRTPCLLAVASQPSGEGQCILTVFVPVHRCGAVPDSHRVPSSPHRQVEEPKTGRGIWRQGIFVNCEYRGRDSNPQPLRSERSTSTRLGYRGMCFHCWDCECRKRESNPQPPDSRSGASTRLGYSGVGTAGLRRAAGGIRTRVHLSGAQGPRASRPRPHVGGALLQGIEPCSHGRRPCCDPIASKSLCCVYPVRESNPSFRIESAVSSPIDERGRRAGPGKARGRVPFGRPASESRASSGTRTRKLQSPGGRPPISSRPSRRSRAVSRPGRESASMPVSVSFRDSRFIGLCVVTVVMVTAPFIEKRRGENPFLTTPLRLPLSPSRAAHCGTGAPGTTVHRAAP